MKKIIIVLLALFLSSCGNLNNSKERVYTIEKIESKIENVLYSFSESFTIFYSDIGGDFKVGDKVKFIMVKVE